MFGPARGQPVIRGEHAIGSLAVTMVRGLKALHELCASDPDGVALNLLDAHMRSKDAAVTIDDVSEQMHLLGIADTSFAWVGARAALWRRADWARYRTAEGHLYYLRDDGLSQWEHPMQHELRSLHDAARRRPADISAPPAVSTAERRSGSWPTDRPPPRGGHDAQFKSPRGSPRHAQQFASPRPESPTHGSPRPTSPANGAPTAQPVAATASEPSARGHPESKDDADLAANFAAMQSKLEVLQARLLEPTLVEEDRQAAAAAFAAARARAEGLQIDLGAAEAAKDRAAGDLRAVRAHAAAQASRETRERAAAADRATEKLDAARNAAVAADTAEKIARRDANAVAAHKADLMNAAAAAHAAAAFLAGSRFRALLRANEQLQKALGVQEADRAAAAKRTEVQKRSDSATRAALETATHRVIAEKSKNAEDALVAMREARAALSEERVAKDARAVAAAAALADEQVARKDDAAAAAAALAAEKHARSVLTNEKEALGAALAKSEAKLTNIRRDRDYSRSKCTDHATLPPPPTEERRMGRGASEAKPPRPPPGPPPGPPPASADESKVLVV